MKHNLANVEAKRMLDYWERVLLCQQEEYLNAKKDGASEEELNLIGGQMEEAEYQVCKWELLVRERVEYLNWLDSH